MKAPTATKSSVVSVPTEIHAACKIAFSQGKPYVVATRECLKELFPSLKDDEHYLDAFNVRVIEDGYLDHVAEKLNLTTENMLHD